MRFLLKVSFPVEAGNAASKNGFKAIQSILEEQKPEAFLVINMEDASEIPAIAEPWFLALNAAIEGMPAMIPADLQKAAPAIAQAVKTYG